MNFVCRTCLGIIKDDTVYNHLTYASSGNGVNDREKLEACVPEMTVDIVLEPLICDTCRDNLSIAFLFKIQCLETEKTLYNYIQSRRQNENCTDLLNNYDLLTLFKNEIILEHNYSSFKLEFVRDDSYTVLPSSIQSSPSPIAEKRNEIKNEIVMSELKPKRNAAVQASKKLKHKCNIKIRKTKLVQRPTILRRSLRSKLVKKLNSVKKTKIVRKRKQLKTKLQHENEKLNTYSKFNDEENVQEAIRENEENVINEIKPSDNSEINLLKDAYKPKLTYRNTNRFQCTKCDKAFSYRCHFDVHLKSHIFKKLYSCPICDKSFSQDKYLRSHRLLHSRKALFQCALCNKCLSSRPSLQRHIKTHTGERPFVCNECGKRFGQKIQLAVHQRTHTGSRPFTCNVCSATFAQKCHLLGHIRIHTGEKPYECDKCMKRFLKSNALRIHLQIHEDKPYQCNGCTKFFRELSSYRKHVSKYLPKCVAGRRVYKAKKLKPKLPKPESKSLEEIDDDINEINMVENMERSKKLTRLKYFCKVCNKGFTTNFSRNRHVKFQHITQ